MIISSFTITLAINYFLLKYHKTWNSIFENQSFSILKSNEQKPWLNKIAVKRYLAENVGPTQRYERKGLNHQEYHHNQPFVLLPNSVLSFLKSTASTTLSVNLFLSDFCFVDYQYRCTFLQLFYKKAMERELSKKCSQFWW